MRERKEKLRELEQNIQRAFENLVELSSKYHPDSNEVRNAKEQRFAAERLVDFRGLIRKMDNPDMEPNKRIIE